MFQLFIKFERFRGGLSSQLLRNMEFFVIKYLRLGQSTSKSKRQKKKHATRQRMCEQYVTHFQNCLSFVFFAINVAIPCITSWVASHYYKKRYSIVVSLTTFMTISYYDFINTNIFSFNNDDRNVAEWTSQLISPRLSKTNLIDVEHELTLISSHSCDKFDHIS